MRVCIYGAGAMGSSLGGLLAQKGVIADLVSRDRDHVNALNSNGVKFLGAEEKSIPVRAIFPEQMVGEYDVIFLATSQRENREIALFLSDYLKKDGALVSVQNGYPEEGLSLVLGADRVYGCALSWGAERVSAGTVRITSTSGYHFALGAFGKGEMLPCVKELLDGIGRVDVFPLKEIRYAKLAVNASFSTLSTVTGLSFYALAKKYPKRVFSIIKEVFSLAKAEGCKRLPLNGHDLFKVFKGVFVRVTLPIAMRKYRQTHSGMSKALSKGRRTDVDALTGVVIEKAKRYGILTPNLCAVTRLIHDIEDGLAEISPESLQLLDE